MILHNFLQKVAKLNELIKSQTNISENNSDLILLNSEVEKMVQEMLVADYKHENIAELKESEERFRKLFEDSADATLIIEDNRFVDCNKATLEMLRMDTKDQVFNTHPSILSPELQPGGRLSIEKAEDMINIAFSKGSNRFEWIHKRSDGELFYAEVLLTKIYQNKKELLHCVWRDITHRKNTDRALKLSEEKFKFLFEQAGDGILVGDTKGIIINANESILKITGYSVHELIGNSISILFPKDILDQKPLRYDLLEAGQSVLSERKLQKKDNSIIDIEMNSTKMKNGNLQAFFRDITEWKSNQKNIIDKNNELKAAEDNLKKLNAELLIMNKQLEKSKNKAEESDRLKSKFLANMSHEIRTPMNGILGFAELLRTPNISTDTQEMYIKIIEQSGNRMLDIINNLIDISRIEAGQIDIYYEITDVNEIMENLFKFFLPEAENKNINLKYSKQLPEKESNIKTDKTKLNQIITNLVKNAIKFTDAGQIEFGCTKDNEFLKFFIKDSGIGIESGFATEIFQRFKQADSSKTESYDGAGLGLSISKAFVEALGGKIWFDSVINKGSIFYFTIPYKKE